MEAYELELLKDMSQEQRMFFQTEFNSVRKNPTTALLLALFLGGFGAHHFYLGKIGLGVLYVLFVWTFIPAIVALIECFVIKSRVRKWNEKKASEIDAQVRVLHAKATGAGS